MGDTAIVGDRRSSAANGGACDIVGRLGGDEFLIVLCHAHSMEGNEVIQRIHDNLAARTILVDHFEIPLTASVGVALTRCGPGNGPDGARPRGGSRHVRGQEGSRPVTFDLAAFARPGSGEGENR